MQPVLAIIAAALLGVLLTGRLAVAETSQDCSQLDGTTSDRVQCFERVYEAADAEQEALYRKLLDSLIDPGERTLLETAQRAWIQYRERECEFETAGTRLGTIHPIVVRDCLTEKTKAHIAELRRQLDCPSGDTGCLHQQRQ